MTFAYNGKCSTKPRNRCEWLDPVNLIQMDFLGRTYNVPDMDFIRSRYGSEWNIPKVEPYGQSQGDLLVLGWGGTHGAIRSAVKNAQELGHDVSHVHLRYLNPLPSNLGDLLLKYQKVLIPELNLGQLAMLIRSKFLVDAKSLSKVKGKPFNSNEILREIENILKGVN